jgi:gluconolactonase
VDAEGGVWVAAGDAGRVVRFGADGSLDRELEVPASFVSSLCFGGDDMRDVYVTTGDGKLLRGRSGVPGLRLPAARA